jgi:hypothetical protein
MFRRPPGRLFHVVLIAVPAVWIVLVSTTPGPQWLFALPADWLVLIGAVIWAVRLGTYALARHHGRATGLERSFLIAPIAGVVVIALVWLEIPLRVRWAVSKPAFQAAVENAPPPTDVQNPIEFDASDWVGTYKVLFAYRVGDGAIFYEASGVGFDDAGFAYLPTGPFVEVESAGFERPQFRALGGGWYAWTASW